MSKSAYIFIQVGARRSYAVPALLAKNNILQVFYTDICGSAGWGKWLNRLVPSKLRPASLQRLLNRKVPDVLVGKTITFDWIATQLFVNNHRNRHKPHHQYHELAHFNHAFSGKMIKRGIQGATHVFTMFTEGLEFVQYAKSQGLKTVMEVYISPTAWNIVQQERHLYPGIEPVLEEALWEGSNKMWEVVRTCVDHFIVPSEFVVDGLEAYGISRNKTHIVPYAVHDSWFDVIPTPKKGRILFVGSADLRKGIHILAEAASRLKDKSYEFRVVGNTSQEIISAYQKSGLEFVGRVPRHAIQSEFAQADIFVLPSLAEGSAEVTYEALAAGLPIITTKASGSVVRDQIEGFIVPERDAAALAEKIELLLENRTLRHQMALAARERAKEYTWTKYGDRLLAILNQI